MTAVVVITSVDQTRSGASRSQYHGTWSAVSENGELKLDTAALTQTQ
jgi:hypothetical protein